MLAQSINLNINDFSTLKGKLITFEGIDGSGKSTQLELLGQWVQQTYWPYPKIITTAEPSGFDTSLGDYLKDLLLHTPPEVVIYPNTELLLYLADRAQHVEEYIKPYLEDGYLVLCDRYIDSSFAYQVIGNRAHGALLERVAELLKWPEPDLTFYLDLPIDIAQQRAVVRGKLDRVESLNSDYFRRVTAGYQGLALTETHRVQTIDGTQAPTVIHQEIISYIQSHFLN